VPYPEKHYRWTWELEAPREALWPLVSDTDAYNRDCGFPPFEVREPRPGEPPAGRGVRRLRSRYLGVTGEWEEREFEWVEPVRFTVERVFSKGPIDFMIQSCALESRTGGGTLLTYEMRVRANSLLGSLLVPVAVGLRQRRASERVFARYDRLAMEGVRVAARSRAPSPAARLPRVEAICTRLRTASRQPAPLVERLASHVLSADDPEVWRMRPYVLADSWGTGRRETLDVFLHATRAGLLDFSWQVLCPHCRGSRQGLPELSGVSAESHCDSCGIDFTVNFEQSVELTFVPNPTVRTVVHREYCLGGPRITPHIVAQKRLAPGEVLSVAATFPEGRYRVRTEGQELQMAFRIERGGAPLVHLEVGGAARSMAEPAVGTGGVLNLRNTGPVEHLAVIERVAWSDQAVTAAAVTSRQTFRDLFAREVLRPGERISVGVMTIVFTDLRNSTQLYREIGDATAFGRVMGHFDVIRAAVSEEGGTLVKTMGDAVMAAFTQPAAALRAMARAQSALASPENARATFALKCAIHSGPCLAVNQNERLDYFGTTVNVCSRLCALSSGADIVASEALYGDPEVAALFAPGGAYGASRDSAPLKGIPGGPVGFWRIIPKTF
jgi:class 3 adenylate cyclase